MLLIGYIIFIVVIYGQLPPDIRSMQARLFNEDNSGYDILVASDAIGMGLNLNIGRVIFHTTVKRGRKVDGPDNDVPNLYFVDPSNVKQIAGRAGRRSSQYKVGEVTAWQETDLAYIRGVMMWDIPQIKAAGLFPSIEQIEMFSEQLASVNQESVNSPLKSTASSEQDDLVISDEDAGEAEEVPLKNNINATIDRPIVSGAVPILPTNIQLASILDSFIELSKLDGGNYFMCNYSDMVLVSNWLHSIPLTLSER